MTELEASMIALRAAREANVDLAPMFERFNKASAASVADGLGDSDWLVDNTFSVADVVCVEQPRARPLARHAARQASALGAYVERGHAREAYERAQNAGAAAA